MEDYRGASLLGWSTVAGDWVDSVDFIDRQVATATEWILDAVALEPGERVLELACGPATLGLAAARAVEPDGQVICTDFAETMLEGARERLATEGVANAEFEVMDAEAIALPDRAVDAVLCRHGYMLMADPAAALRESARILQPGGRLAFAVWAEADSNPWAALPMRAVMGHLNAPPPPPDAPGMWALADHDLLRELLEAAGLGTIRIERLEGTVRYDSFEHWWETTRRLAGPLRLLLANLDDDATSAIQASAREASVPYAEASGALTFPEMMVGAHAMRVAD